MIPFTLALKPKESVRSGFDILPYLVSAHCTGGSSRPDSRDSVPTGQSSSRSECESCISRTIGRQFRTNLYSIPDSHGLACDCLDSILGSCDRLSLTARPIWTRAGHLPSLFFPAWRAVVYSRARSRSPLNLSFEISFPPSLARALRSLKKRSFRIYDVSSTAAPIPHP